MGIGRVSRLGTSVIPRIKFRLRGEASPSISVTRYLGYSLYYGFRITRRAIMLLSMIVAIAIISSLLSLIIYVLILMGFGVAPLSDLPTDFNLAKYLVDSFTAFSGEIMEEGGVSGNDLSSISLFDFNPRGFHYAVSFAFFKGSLKIAVGAILFLSILLFVVCLLNIFARRGFGRIRDHLSKEFLFKGKGKKGNILSIIYFGLVPVALLIVLLYMWSIRAFQKVASISPLVLSTLILISTAVMALLWLLLAVYLIRVRVDSSFTFGDLENTILENIRRGRDEVDLCLTQLRSLIAEALSGQSVRVRGKNVKEIVWGAIEEMGESLFRVEISSFRDSFLAGSSPTISLGMTLLIFTYILWMSLWNEMFRFLDFRLVLISEMAMWPFVMSGYKLFVHFAKFVRYPDQTDRTGRRFAFISSLLSSAPLLAIILVSAALSNENSSLALYLSILLIFALLVIFTRMIPLDARSGGWYHFSYIVYTWLLYGLIIVKPLIILISHGLSYLYIWTVGFLSIGPHLHHTALVDTVVMIAKVLPSLKWDLFALLVASLPLSLIFPLSGSRKILTKLAGLFSILTLLLLLSTLINNARVSDISPESFIVIPMLLAFFSLNTALLGYLLDKSRSEDMGKKRDERALMDLEDFFYLLGIGLTTLALTGLAETHLFNRLLNSSLPALLGHPIGMIDSYMILASLLLAGICSFVLAIMEDGLWEYILTVNFDKYRSLEIEEMATVLGEIYGLMLDPMPSIVDLIPSETRFAERVSPECEYY